MKTRYAKIERQIVRLKIALSNMKRESEQCKEELDKYVRRHKSLSFDSLETGDVERLNQIYAYFDKRYPIEWQGGLRCDDRGMRLVYWVDDDPAFLILHLTSTSQNIFLGGSTSWLVKAETFADKIAALKQIKGDVQKILKPSNRKTN